MTPDERRSLERLAALCRLRKAEHALARAREASAAARAALDAARAAEWEAQAEVIRARQSPWVPLD